MDDRADQDLTAPARIIATWFPRQKGGITLLGSEANAAFRCDAVGDTHAGKHPEQRLQAAIRLCIQAVELGLAQLCCKSVAKAWQIVSRAVAHAFDFDVRVVPPSVLLPALQRLEKVIYAAVGGLTGQQLPGPAWRRASLPTCWGRPRPARGEADPPSGSELLGCLGPA